MTVEHATSLTMKLAHLLEELGQCERDGQRFSFGLIRNLLGKRRIILLPCVKNHHEVAIPSKQNAMDRVRVTVVLEISLIDGETEEQLSSRWIGQAIDEPSVCYDHAITNALEDFLKKTFLMTAANDDVNSAPLPDAPAPTTSKIRRRPQGASHLSKEATPAPAEELASATTTPQAVNEDVQQEEPAPKDQLDLLANPPVAANSDDEVVEKPAAAVEKAEEVAEVEEEVAEKAPVVVSNAWKAANALWRALVAEVVSSDVMDAYEEALEQKHGVDSWRLLEPEEIRACCHELRKRSASGSDARKISEREEFILSQVAYVPEGASLNRIEAEIERLALEVVDEETHAEFLKLYLEKMKVSSLTEVSGKALVALCRKTRRFKGGERREFIWRALGMHSDHEAA